METSESMTVNHHRHMPYLLQAQVRYKRGILNYEDARILRTVIRIGLPSMSIPRSERSSRDEGIIKLLLYFLRNITIIAPSPHLPMEGDENEVSRSATIEAFHQQEVFALLLTMASNMGEDFSFQDIPLLEILFHLLKGISVEKLFMDEEQRKSTRTGELKDILKKESGMNREYAKNAPTRHGRFGTMIWVKRDDEKM
jgi:replication fork protection complex subunit Tof1/Swi1